MAVPRRGDQGFTAKPENHRYALSQKNRRLVWHFRPQRRRGTQTRGNWIRREQKLISLAHRCGPHLDQRSQKLRERLDVLVHACLFQRGHVFVSSFHRNDSPWVPAAGDACGKGRPNEWRSGRLPAPCAVHRASRPISRRVLPSCVSSLMRLCDYSLILSSRSRNDRHVYDWGPASMCSVTAWWPLGVRW